MRNLMWFTLGFAGCLAAAAYGMVYPWLPPAAAVAYLIAMIAACILKRHKEVIRILAGCLAAALWFGGFYQFRLKPLNALDGQEINLCITAVEYSYDTAYGTGVEGDAVIDGKRYRVRAYLDEERLLLPGDAMEGVFRLRMTVSRDPEDSSFHQGNGIFLLAYQEGECTFHAAESVSQKYWPVRLRQGLLDLLQRTFPEDTAPFAKALLLGHTAELDYETDTALKISGIRHIVAVSGLHISILYGVLCTVTGKKRVLTALAGMPALFLFAAVAGFTPSVTRACVMVSLMLLARLLNREYDPATALAFAVLAMLLANPLAITSVSLQLSAGCVAGILLFQAPVNRWLTGNRTKKGKGLSRVRTALCSGVSVTLSSMSLVTPLSAAYFGTVSLVSVLTNLLTLWAVTLIFNGIMLVCILYLLNPGIAAALAGVLSWLIRYVLEVAKILSSFPLAAVYTESVFVVFWLAFVYCLLAVFLLCKERKTGAFVSLGTVGLCAALLLSWILPLTAQTRITVLDVGQGQAIVLQSRGKTFLVDCGGDADEGAADIVAENLLSQGIRRLDGIILTHYDRDHAGGLKYLLTRIDADCLFVPDTRNEFTMPDTDAEIIYVWEDLELTAADTVLKIYGPVYSGFDNENSLCVLFDTPMCDILITGDRSSFGERMLLRNRAIPDVDILVAGHHGAEDSVSEELLRTVKPETVLISAGRDNRYGHPAQTVLQRLAEFGCGIRRTDLEGTIIIRR